MEESFAHKEMWEETGENGTVVNYVLKLFNRFSVTHELVDRNMKAATETAKVY